jgi:hypothetical protein
MRTTALLLCFVGLLANARAATADEPILNLPQLPNGGYQATDVAFPPIVDSSTLRMTLERGPCYGDCPIYKLEVRGDGSVLYVGDGNVAISGHHRAAIPHESVDRLVEAYRKARFFSLLDSYVAGVTDGPWYTISLSFDGRTKTVQDYFGLKVGMPGAVVDLERLVDELAGTNRWIKGSPRSIAELKAEGWDFAGQDDEHQEMILNASKSADPDLFNAILDAGAKPKGFHGCESLSWSIDRSDERGAKKLIALGVPLFWEPARKSRTRWSCNTVLEAIDNGRPEILALLLTRHPDVNHPDDNFGTPLAYLIEHGRDRKAGSDLTACAELLLAAGADPYFKDEQGKTALDIALARRSPLAAVLQRWMAAHPQMTP